MTDVDVTDSVRLLDLERLQDALLSADEMGKLISSSESGCNPPTSTSLAWTAIMWSTEPFNCPSGFLKWIKDLSVLYPESFWYRYTGLGANSRPKKYLNEIKKILKAEQNYLFRCKNQFAINLPCSKETEMLIILINMSQLFVKTGIPKKKSAYNIVYWI